MPLVRFALAFSFAALVVVAQEPVTHVDVVVTDGKGKPVRGLAAADFEVVRDKVASPAASVEEVTDPTARRVLIFFDNGSLSLAHRRQTAAALQQWVAANLRPVDHVAIAAANPSLRQVLAWSNDKAAIAAALDTATRDAGNHFDQDRRNAERLIDDVMNRAASTPENSPIRPSFDEMMRVGRSYAASQMRDTDALLSAVAAALTWYPPVVDKRVMLIAGEGLQRNPGYDMFMHLSDLKFHIEGNGPALLKDSARRASPLTEARQFDVFASIDRLRKSAVERGVQVYALNLGRIEEAGGGSENTRPITMNTGFARTSNAMAGYEIITDSTGGMAFQGLSPEKALDQIASDLASYYVVTYSSAEAGDSTIRTKGGHRVRAARAAAPLGPDERMRDAVLLHHSTAPVTNDLAIKLAMDPPRAQGTERVVPLRVFIPIEKLQIEAAGSEVVGGFAVYISSGNGNGAASLVTKNTHKIRWPPGALEHGRGKNMTFAVEVPLPAGYNAISVGVLDQKSAKTGFERIAVE